MFKKLPQKSGPDKPQKTKSKKSSKFTLKKITIGFVTVLAVIFVFAFGYIAINWKDISQRYFVGPTQIETLENTQVSEFSANVPLVLLAKFTYPKNSIGLEQARLENLLVDSRVISALDEAEINSLAEKFKVDQFKEILIEKSVDLLKINSSEFPENTLVLTHFANTQSALKLLRVDGLHVFRDEDYPLVAQIYRDFSEDQSFGFVYKQQLQDTLIGQEIADKAADLEIDRQGDLSRIFFGGEIIPARAVDRLFLNQTDNYTFLFDRIDEEMKTADLAIAMLENPISGNPQPCTGCTTFVGDARNAQGFKEVGLDILGFGNHAGDGGLNAIKDTEKLLAEAGVEFTGVSSKNLGDAARLVIKEFDGRKLGFLAFDDIAYFYWAGENRWGTNRFSTAVNVVDHERIKSVISAAKKQVDFLVVYPSWGVEYTNKANSQQIALAHAMIDNGVDLIVGSHPHWVQNFEIYKGKPIFYSLGNFVFDQTHTDPTRQGIWVNAYFYKQRLVSFEVIPHLTCGYHQSGNNLANKVINGEMSYADVDALSERQGCIYWQPKPLGQDSAIYNEIWGRFIEYTKL